MHAFEISDLKQARARSGEAYHEFLRVPSMSCGVYALPAGATDPQEPHTEDEVYVVLDGAGTIRVGSEDKPVRSGSVIFVAAGMVHRFHSIREDLTVLVFFAPPEGSAARG